MTAPSPASDSPRPQPAPSQPPASQSAASQSAASQSPASHTARPARPAPRAPGSRRKRKRLHRRTLPGAPPGTLVADPDSPKPRLALFAYGPDALVERELRAASEVREFCGRQPVLWLDVDGLGDVGAIQALGETFGLHKLELEDVVNVHQRAKVDAYGEHLFVVVRMIDKGERLETEQLSLFLGRDFVLTFQERPGDGFGPVRERLRTVRGALRTSGPDYLAYALLDASIDEYFPVLEALGERIEQLEDVISLRPCPEHLRELHAIKRDLLTLRRAIWPLREAVNQLQRDDGGLVSRETRPYLNDLYDHTVQLMDLVETYREIASGLLDVYLSSMSHRLNEVMKVLTLIATIFIPLTFISSLWGMNFVHMPELEWRYGYPAALGLMFGVGLVLLYFFRRRGWLGPRPSSAERAEAEAEGERIAARAAAADERAR